MLSPASLRVCCLAVMAPALTKADRRADCLPVVLSDPFCESKTVTPYNRKDKYNEINLPKLSSRFACLLNNRRKAYIHKTWIRTHLKNSTPEFCFKSPCPPADLHDGKLDVESQSEAWHGTSVTLAVADKVRLKYTMNKNTSSLKNMGLARTNATLGLHSMKKVNRITQFSPRERRGDPSTPDVGESSPDLPDSTNSELETGLTITRVIQIPIGQPCGDVSSSSGESITRTGIEELSNSDGEVTLPVACASPAAEAASHNCSIISPSLSNVNSVSTLKDPNLPVTLTDPECTLEHAASVTDGAEATLRSSPTAGQLNSFQNLLAKACTVPALSDESFVEISSQTVPSLVKPLDVTHSTRSNGSSSSNSSSAFKSEISSVQASFTEPNSARLRFQPDDFLTSSSPPVMGVRKSSSIVLTKNLAAREAALSRASKSNKVPKRKECCPDSIDLSLLNEQYSEGMSRILAAVERSELLIRVCISAYAKKEIGELVHSYQNKLGIPCQRQLRNNIKTNKDPVDLKAELLQNEDVKSLSTAALVNLVRKLETSGTPGNLLPHQSPSVVDASSSEAAVLAFAPDDVADVIHTSRELLTQIKKELELVDPDLTESSDEGGSDLESQENETAHKMALWEFMKERAALTCRSTWLIARIHELENQLRTAVGAMQKISASVGGVCFEELLATSESASSTAGYGDAIVTKQCKVKGLTKPVNGYLDHSPKSNIAHIGQSVCTVETLPLDEDQSNADLLDPCQQCSRTKALNVSSFQKRDVLVTTGLHVTNSKLAKLSTVGCHCSCQDDILPCALCMGRYRCVQGVDPDSMPLLDRVSLLDSNFHPLLSFQKDVPLILHFENILKKNESQYQVVRPASPTQSHRIGFGTKPKHFTDARSRSRKLNRYARTLLSAKYRNKHIRNTKHLRKHRLVFGKWRKFQSKNNFQARERVRRISIDSSGSSHDSPVPSPGSVYEDGFDCLRRRRDDNQFDIDDVIIPYSNKSVRLVEFEFKDIVVPSFRVDGSEKQNTPTHESSGALLTDFLQAEESTLEEAFLSRHDPLEIDEKKINRRPSVANLLPIPKRARREHRFDSRADSSGANTPDPVLFCDQDMFQDHGSMTAPTPPALSPPMTPSSVQLISDDSQPSLGSTLASRLEKKRVPPQKRPSEENTSTRPFAIDTEEVAPYELRTFPLSDEQFEEIALDPYGEDIELTVSGPSSPASPGSTTLSTSTIEDVTDPEWMVLKNNPSHESGLKLKLAKR